MNRHLLLLTCAAGAFALLGGASQAATSTAASTATAADTDQSTASVSEIVVTAQKREENLQSVAVAISAFTAKQRDKVGIVTFQDYTNFTPGLTYSSAVDHVSIRGISRLAVNQSADAAVANYTDGFYTTSAVEAGKPPLDIAQVEVLRGPQGTLYGRNAIGGAINIISRKPTMSPYAEARAVFGSYGQMDYQGAVSGPLTDHIQARLFGFWNDQGEGYFTNVAGGPNEGGKINEWYIEPQIQGQFFDNKLEVWAKAFVFGWNNRGDAGARTGYLTGAYDTGSLIANPNAYLGSGLFYNAQAGYNPALTTGLTQMNPGVTGNPAIGNVHNFSANTPLTVTNGGYDINGTAVYHAPAFDIKYIGGYQTYDYKNRTDLDSTDINSYTIPLVPGSICSAVPGCQPLTIFPSVTQHYREKLNWYSHELDFVSTDKASPVQWIGGLYFFHEEAYSPYTISVPNQPQVLTPGSLFGGAAAPNPAGNLFSNSYDTTSQSVAGFGQVDWKVTDTVKLTGGIRYSYDEKKSFETLREIAFSDNPTILLNVPGTPFYYPDIAGELGTLQQATDITPIEISLAPGAGIASGVTFNSQGYAQRLLKGHSDAWTGTAGVEWTPEQDMLAYFRYSRGYKELGFNAGYIGPNPEAKPEFLDSFEVGLKKTFFRTLTIDTALYYYDYANAQIPIGVLQGGTVSQEFINIAHARSDGFEFEGTWAPIDNLSLIASYSFEDTAVTSGCHLTGGVATGDCYQDPADPTAVAPGAHPVGAVGGLQSVQGNPLPNAPRNKIALNANYTWKLDQGSLTPSVTWVWRDSQYGSIFKRFYNEAPSWNQTDVRLSWVGADDRYEVIFFGRNVFNNAAYEAGAPGASYGGSPTYTYGTTFVNGAPVVTINGVPTTAAGFPIISTYPGQPTANPRRWANVYELAPPATYGVELHYKFF